MLNYLQDIGRRRLLLITNLYAMNYFQGAISVLFQATKCICFIKKVTEKNP